MTTVENDQKSLFQASSRWNKIAVAGFVLVFFSGVLGIIFGAIGLSQTSRTGDRGRGLAASAIAIGILKTIGLVSSFAFWGLWGYWGF
ncbi:MULTISPECIES: DUF4190 domain-containing protein [unclassified Leifsonia]|uniref:DUF4190 domain-containing protein n=1 Tax=unclassified Leifsonia TaxID=2663824 RepID=UPI0008A7C363|nr:MULTISPECIES: DUF4190 domain-containing protein [unclassified Leifsonia]SEI10381.1 hypothetical protein SAMN04515694_11582 [Leifsonia sp. CL154]SFL86173.1 hypothetical protein SAMN04515692_11526 [Leifsonia sp. CL147]